MTPLRQRMIEDMEIRNLSPETIKGYLFPVSRFAKHFNQSPDLLGIDQIRQYQVYLLRERKLAASTLNHVLSALRFFYKVTLGREWALEHLRYPRRAKRLPAVLSKPEVYRVFSVTRNPKHRTLLMTMYATGMRVSEAARLRVDDIDSKRMLIRVHQGKGKKDRYVPLSTTLLQALRTYWKKVRSRGALFPSQQGGGPLTTGSITKVCADASKKTGQIDKQAESKKRACPQAPYHVAPSFASSYNFRADSLCHFRARKVFLALYRAHDWLSLEHAKTVRNSPQQSIFRLESFHFL